MIKTSTLFTVCLGLIVIAAARDITAHGLIDDIGPARLIFLDAVDGHKPAVRAALEAFRSLGSRYPNHPLLQAYIGSTLSLRGRDAARPTNKMRETENGLVSIDRALTMLKQHSDIGLDAWFETKLVAAATFMALPEFFHRGREGQRLVDEVMIHPGLTNTPAPLRAFAYMSAATAARKAGKIDDYKRFLTLVVQTDPQGRNGRKAQEELDLLDTPPLR